MRTPDALSPRNSTRVFKKVSMLLTGFVLVGVLTAGFMVVSGRAAGLGFHSPVGLTRIFASKTTTTDTAAARASSAPAMQPFAPLAVTSSWDFSPLTGGANNFGASPLAASSSDSNVTVGGLTRGTGIGTTGTGAANAWGGNDFTGTSQATAITNNEFATFTITANSGFTASLSDIAAYNIRRSGTGPTTGIWQYQIGAGAFTDIGTPITWGAITTAAGNPQSAITLSGISALQNVPAGTTITLRVVTWGATGTAGTWYLNDPADTAAADFIVNGTVAAAAPLPTLGTYFSTVVGLSGNVFTANPSAPPANATSLTAFTTSNFYGTFTVDNTTGAVRITNAHPAGNYTVTVKGFGPGGTATRTFNLTVSIPPLCTGSVAFVAAADVSGPEAIQNVTTGDFNNDGKQDIVFARFTNNAIAIRLGDGAGNFSGTGGAGVGASPWGITAGDFNGDGKLDAATANESGQSISFALGDGLGSLAAATTISAGFANNEPKDIRAADMNNDGKLDLVFVTGGLPPSNFSQIGVAIGDGAGGFAAPTYTSTTVSGGLAYGMAVGDLNNDGNVDVAVAHYIAASYSVSLGNGTGGFTSTTNYGTAGTGAAFVALGDVNNGNGPDLIGTVISNNTLPFANNGAGAFSPLPTLATPGAESVVIGDFNHDGNPDLAVAEAGAVKRTSIWLGSGTGNFTASGTTSGGFSPVGSAIADVNGDGYQDILTANGNGSSGLVTVRLGACAAPNVVVTGGNLVITESNVGTTADTLTVSLNGANVRITDPNNALSAGAGTTQVNANTVDVPLVSITGNIQVNTLGGNDTLTLSLAGGDFIPAGGLSYAGGGQTSTPGDKLVIAGGNQGTVTYNYTNAHDGSVVMSNFGTVSYTGLEPITNSGSVTDVIFNLPAVPNAATLADDGTGGNTMSRLSGATFETTDFANPSGSLTINRGDATDTLAINALPDLNSSLTFGSAALPFSTLTFNGAVTLASGKNLAGNATGTINFPNATSDIATTGAGTLTLTTARNISLTADASIRTVDGPLTLSANQQVTPTTGNFVGVDVSGAGALVQTTGTGTLTVMGKGGDDVGGSQIGVRVQGNGDIIGGTIGLVTVQGRGGAGANVNNFGVQVTSGSGSSISSGGANVSVTGNGGGTGSSSSNHGVLCNTGGQILAGGSGTVTVTGFGGNLAGTAGSNNGVFVSTSGATITSSGGKVTVTGTGGGANNSFDNAGVYLSSSNPGGGQITAGGSGAVEVIGHGGNAAGTGSNNYGVVLDSTNATITSGGGNVSVSGDGGGSGSSGGNIGVFARNGGQITAGGSGTVTVLGQGGNTAGTGNGNQGVAVFLSPARITSSGGNVSVTGTGGGSGSGGGTNSNQGVTVVNAGQITAGGSGTVTVVGTDGGGNGGSDVGVDVTGASAVITSGGGNVTVTGTEGPGFGSNAIHVATSGSITTATNGGTLTLAGNSMNFDGTAIISAQSGSSVTLRQRTNGVAINLGAATNPNGGPLSLTDAELDRVTAGTVNLGDANSGAITVSADITRAAATILNLTSGANIDLTTGALNSGGGNVTFNPGTNVFATRSGVDVTTSAASTLNLTTGKDLKSTINTTTVDSGYTQLNVAGLVNLNSANLSFAGSTYIPVVGASFMIVNNDGADAITGTFANGPTFTNFLGSAFTATISYTGGDGNDAVLTVDAPPCGPQSTVYVDDNWVGTPVGTDPDAGGPATNFGCDSFATIQGGVNGVTTGGTVIVYAGTYNGPQILINRSMSVLGAGLATTTIDGLTAVPPSAGLVHIETPLGDTGNVTFSGFTVTNPGLVVDRQYAIFAKPLDPATTVTISNNRILGVGATGPAIFDLGLWVYRNLGSIVFDHNDISNVGGNKVLIEQPLNATDVHHNTIAALGASSTYFNFTYDAENVSSLQRVADNTINGSQATAINFNPSSVNVVAASRFGKYTNVQITNNVITQLGAGRSGIALLNDTTDPTGAAGAVENPIITGNKVTGTNAATSNGIRFRGLVTNATITGNDLRNTARGFFGEVVNTHSATGTQAHVNDIVGNTVGVDWNGTAALNAENNWWGCNFGPGVGGAGCSGTANGLAGTGIAMIDADPWLVLGVSAAPNPIPPAGGMSTVTADMTDNSVAADTTGSGTVPLTPVAFTAGAGTMAPPSGTITAGIETSVYTSNSPLNGFACALVDSQTTCTPIMKNGATAASGSINGRITDGQGQPVSGTVVRLSGGQSRKTITDANGDYHFDNVVAGDFYTVMPTRANFGFSPAQRSFSVLGNNTEALFTGLFNGETANPLDTPEYYVRQQYLDILAREPDEAGFNYWSDQILACGEDARCAGSQRTGVAAAFFIENEAQQTGSFIYDVYAGTLGRRPAFGEYTADRGQVVGGGTLDGAKTAFAQSFVQRAEFMTKYANATTAETFVDALIESAQSSGGNVSVERSNLISLYGQTADQLTSRAAVVRSLADNATFKQSQFNQAFVLTEYFSYLRREIDLNGYTFWVGVLATGDPGNYRGMVCSFVTSTEYQNRFSSVVSHSNGECGQ